MAINVESIKKYVDDKKKYCFLYWTKKEGNIIIAMDADNSKIVYAMDLGTDGDVAVPVSIKEGDLFIVIYRDEMICVGLVK